MFSTHVLTTVIVVAASICQSLAQLSKPPEMTFQPIETIYFKDGETVELPCRANSVPRPIFTWQKDERPFEASGNDDRWVQLPNEGTLVCNRPEAKDVGVYQCFAKNDHGTALSIKINLQQGRMENFTNTNERTFTRSLGSPITLPCTPPMSLPTAEYTWILLDKSGSWVAIDYDQHITMDYFGNLHLTNLQVSDAYTNKAYVCMAINEFMRKNALGPPMYIKAEGQQSTNTQVEDLWRSPVETKGYLGGESRMKCIFAGNPTPRVEWRRGRGVIPPLRSRLDSMGMELVIFDLRLEDMGEYECRGNNEHSTRPISKTFKLKILAKPTWDIKPKNVETSVGGKATFICKGSGEPRPSLVVRLNGVKLQDLPSNPNRIAKDSYTSNSTGMNITFINLSKTDSLVVQCNISNIIAGAYLFTNAYLNILEDPPEFLRPPRPQVVVAEDQSINLTCQTRGKPDPVITWYKGGQPVTGGRYMTQLNGDLMIEGVVLADAGSFGCEAVNKFGRVAANGTLAVRRRTRIEQIPLDLEVIGGLDAKFTCSATTDTDEVGRLVISWLKDDKPITTDNQRMTTNYQDNSLTVTGTIARDSGRYTCVASNGLDNATSAAMLTVKGKPDPPSDVSVITCYQDRAFIEWNPGSNNNAPLLHFLVQYNTTFTPDMWSFAQQVKSNQNNAIIPLSPWANYTFRVLSSNKIGDSEPSTPTPAVCKTNPDVPFQNPANVRTIGEKKKYLIVEWTEMPEIEHNAQGFEYLLSYRRQGDTDTSWIKHTISPFTITRREIELPITEAQAYEPYEIKVKAKNSRGDARDEAFTVIGHSGEAEPQVSAGGLALVTDPKYDITATTATLEWDPIDTSVPNLQAVRGQFMGYRVQYWKQQEKQVTFREEPVPHNTWNSTRKFCRDNKVCVQLTNLFPFSYIEAQVVVMNNFYIGPPSSVISFRTIEGVPGPVREFRAIVAGPNHFLLDWKLPEITDENGKIVGYDIGYQTVIGLDLGKMQDREPQIHNREVLRTSLSGLRPFQKYRIHIWARTIKGRGEDYFIEVTTTKPGPPDAPRFSFAFIGENMLNVTWQRQIEGGERSGSIYYVEYRKQGASEWMQTPEESVSHWSNVTGLESGTVYQVRVVATTGTLLSTSAIQEVNTLGVGAIQIAGAGWLVGMMLAIVFVIILIILICVVVVFLRKNCEYMFAGREDDYYEGPEYNGPPAAEHSRSQYPVTSSYPTSYGNEQSYPQPQGGYGEPQGGYGESKYPEGGYNKGYYDNQQFQYDEPPGGSSPGARRNPPNDMEKGPPDYSDLDSFEEFADPEGDGQEAGKFDKDGFIHSNQSATPPSARFQPEPQEPGTPNAMSTFV